MTGGVGARHEAATTDAAALPARGIKRIGQGPGATGARLESASLNLFDRLTLLVVALTCSAFVVLTPPFQAPDEPQHLSRAWALAHGRMFAESRGWMVGGEEPIGYIRLSLKDFPREDFETQVRYRPADIGRAGRFTLGDEAKTFVEYPNVSSYAPTLYAPQAVALALGEALGARPLLCFYFARLLNAFTFLALLWAAVRATPFGRPILLAIAALPTSAYQAASVSPDATIEGLSWLAIALSLRLGHAAVRRRGSALDVIAVPLGLAKGLYAPLVLAGARRGALLRCALAFAIAAASFVVWTKAAGGNQPVYQVVSRQTGELVTTAPMSAQLGVLLSRPFLVARAIATDMMARSPVYLMQIVGRFGWNAVLLPLLAYPLALIMLSLGVASGAPAVGRTTRAWWAGLAIGSAVLVELALYLTGTPLGVNYVQGVQGRYFLPFLPLLLLAFAPVGGASGARKKLPYVAALLNLIALATVVDAFWVHGFVNHKGLPPIAHDIAGVARALTFPSPRW